MKETIVLIDPDPNTQTVVRRAAETMGLPFESAPSVEAALERLPQLPASLVLLNLTAAHIEEISRLRHSFPNVEVIALAGESSIAEATEAMRQGALDYIPRPFGTDEIILAIRRWQQQRELQTEKERLSEVLYLMELGRTLTSTLDLNQLYDQIITLVKRAFLPDTVSLMLLRETERGPRLVIVAQRGLGNIKPGTEVSLEGTIAGLVVQQGEPLVLLGGLKGTPYEHMARGGPIGSAMSVPLKVQQRTLGVLNVNRGLDRMNYTEQDADLLKIFASQIAIAVQNAQLYESLRQERDRILEVEENVRRELARDLHDHLAQTLNSIALHADYLRLMLEQGNVDTEWLQAELNTLRQTARQAVREARSLVFGLRPLVLETRGLVPALEALVEQIRESEPRTRYHFLTEAVPARLPLSQKKARVVFAILQEAIHNVRKHARARNVFVRLRISEDGSRLICEVEDDGVGFDLAAVEAHYDERNTFGLLNMRERAELIEAELTIESEPGQGTLVRLVVPLDEEFSQD